MNVHVHVPYNNENCYHLVIRSDDGSGVKRVELSVGGSPLDNSVKRLGYYSNQRRSPDCPP